MSIEPASSSRQIGRSGRARGNSKISVQRGETLISTDFKRLLPAHRPELHRSCDYSRYNTSFQSFPTAFRSILLCKKERRICV
jgi:hypothetical protein